MGDCISRRKAINTVEDAYRFSDGDIEAYHDAMVASLTELIAEQPKTGRWIYHETLDVFECSVCGGHMVRNVFYYCPWCEAKMEVEHD